MGLIQSFIGGIIPVGLNDLLESVLELDEFLHLRLIVLADGFNVFGIFEIGFAVIHEIRVILDVRIIEGFELVGLFGDVRFFGFKGAGNLGQRALH